MFQSRRILSGDRCNNEPISFAIHLSTFLDREFRIIVNSKDHCQVLEEVYVVRTWNSTTSYNNAYINYIFMLIFQQLSVYFDTYGFCGLDQGQSQSWF